MFFALEVLRTVVVFFDAAAAVRLPVAVAGFFTVRLAGVDVEAFLTGALAAGAFFGAAVLAMGEF